MKKRERIIIFLTAILLSSCVSIAPASNQYTPTPIKTSTFTKYFKYQRNCLDVETTIPLGFLSEGAILLGYLLRMGVQPLFYNTEDNILQPIRGLPEDNNILQPDPDLPIVGIKIVSPDGKWLAYDAVVEEDSRRYLGIEAFASQPLRLIPFSLEEGWSDILYWLDNSRVVVGTGEYGNEASGDGEVVINVFTGEMVNFDLSGLGTSVHFDYFPRFDPTLSRVVYFRDVDNTIVLLDWETGNELWTLEVHRRPANISPIWLEGEALPQWSPDGTRFVLGGPVGNPDDLVHELLIVNRDGNVEQMTQFEASGFQDGTIHQPRWSPDQRYIAFWFANSLTVFDTLTGIATDYCMEPAFVNTSDPVWSMDSSQIAFENEIAYDAYPKRVIVLDIQENRAFEVAENYYVLGWMTTLP